MAERSFKKEIEYLSLGDGETFTGEGILAITKALLESGVGYVGGYQGAPISHLMDVLADAEELLNELDVRFEANASEAAAAAIGRAWNVGPAEFGPRGAVELLPSASVVDTRSFRAVSGGGGIRRRDASALAASLLRI